MRPIRISGAIIALVAAVAVLLVSTGRERQAATAQAGVQTFFLEVEGFQGESEHVQFPHAIEAMSFEWDASNPDGKSPLFRGFTVQKRVDRTSPKLLEHVGAGTVIPSARLRVIKAGGDQAEYLRYCFTNLRVTDLQSHGNSGDDLVLESVTFSYSTIIQRYSRQKPDGSLEAPVFGGWDTVKNQPFGPAGC
jgi:type VI protein secretion system component Hcp